MCSTCNVLKKSVGEPMEQTERFTEEEREELLANPYTDSIMPGGMKYKTL